MSKTCSNCGTVLDDNAAFCTECGTPAPAASAAPAESKPAPAYDSAPAPTVTAAPAPRPAVAPVVPVNDAVVGTGKFFLFSILFKLPFIGWIVCLITTLAAKNRNVKHYAKSQLIWVLIGIVVAIITAVTGIIIFKRLFTQVNAQFGTNYNDIGDLLTGIADGTVDLSAFFARFFD